MGATGLIILFVRATRGHGGCRVDGLSRQRTCDGGCKAYLYPITGARKICVVLTLF